MKKARIHNFGTLAGTLKEIEKGKLYKFSYDANYTDAPISQTMIITQKEYTFLEFPPFFDGLLPEGNQLESLLRQTKTDREIIFRIYY